jgi:hypothetical protein
MAIPVTRKSEALASPAVTTDLTRASAGVAQRFDADVYFFSGRIDRPNVNRLLAEYGGAEHRENCILVLSTFGGDPDAAYILARFFRRAYERFSICIFGLCKSAGTLACLGADDIVMTPFGELGPLDIQLSKDDSLAARTSGLDIFQALAIISTQAFTIFQQHFLGIVAGSGGVITTRTAADIGTAVAGQLLSPITAQIDPLRLGEIQRALQVAMEYGVRLGADEAAVRRLAMGYPAHGFVIDLEEAQELLPGKVRAAEPEEMELEAALRDYAVQQYGQDVLGEPVEDEAVCVCLTRAAALQREFKLNGDETHGTEHDQGSAPADFAGEAGRGARGEGEPAGPGDGGASQQEARILTFPYVPTPRAGGAA